MMILNSIVNFLCEQTDAEKTATVLGISLLVVLLLVFIVDSVVKNNIVPKNGNVRLLLIFVFTIAVIALILLIIYYV